MLRGLRIGSFAIAACLAVVIAMPAHEAAAQDAIGGAILGGVGGAIVGGAIGGGRGAAIGAVVGAGTGAAIASEGEPPPLRLLRLSARLLHAAPGRLLCPGRSAILLLSDRPDRV
jgi:hypothetical protein